MTYQFAPSFSKAFRRLPLDRQQRVDKAVDRLINLFEAGQIPGGLGLKKLRHGNHDEVRRYLKGL